VPGEILVLREAEIRELLDPHACLEAVEAAFAAYSTGRAELPAVIQLDVPERRGEIHVKAGHLHGGAHYAVKVASGFPGNEALGLPASGGLVLAFDARTGHPSALLLDNGYITDLRTGIAGAVAAKHLARPDAGVAAVIGTGAQARHQMRALSLVRPIEEIRIFGRSPEKARACAADLMADPRLERRCRVMVAESVREAMAGAAVVVTATASREPLVRAAWLAPGMHLTAVGSDQPDKQELEPDALARADRIVADSRPQCLRLGEIHHAVAAGAIGERDVDAELGEIAAGLKPGRAAPDEITVCDLTGVGVQDVAAANVVLGRALEAGIGERIPLA
jgi:ornithine cyclodeaminase